MKLTYREVENLKPRSKRYEVWEEDGLGIRIFPSGKRSWVFLYRFEGRPRRVTFGPYPALSVAGAHKAHGTALEQLEKGIDPGAVLVDARRADREAITVADLVKVYIRDYAKPRKRSWKSDELLLDKGVVPWIGRKKAKDVKRREVVALLDRIVLRGTPIQANRTFGALRKCYNWGVSRSLVESSPCDHVERPSPEHRRDRVLSDDDLRKLWIRLEEPPLADRVRLALRLAIATAQRVGEIVGASWNEIDLEAGWWTIPAERSKNKLPHRVPITKLTKRILLAAKESSWDPVWVFPSVRKMNPKENRRPLERHALRRWIQRNREALEIEPFHVHDLRRTAASHMTSIGIPRLTVKKILNHAEPDVVAVYDRYSYDGEKRGALAKWNAHLEGISQRSREGAA